jgi:CelD/BcsL family acetyltransferase involved in cellulose biosynthesis
MDARRRLRALRREAGAPGTSGEHWRVLEYGGRQALERLEADWRRLYAAMPIRTSTHLYEAHLAYFDHLMASPEKYRCLALSDGRRIRAICPLEARDETALGIPVAVWAIPCHPLTSEADAICADDDARRALAPAVATFLRQHRGGRRLLVLGPVRTDSALWDGVRQIGPLKHCTHVTELLDFFDCEQSFEELMSRLKKHFRRNIRSHRNKLARLDEALFATAAEETDLGAAFETFLDVEASGWKGENGARTAIRFKPNQPAFFRAVASTFDDGDRCEINTLHVEGRCIAADFCLRTGTEYARIKIGYDEDHSRLGPGQLLMETTLERLCGDPGVKHFNMESDSGWLEDWHPDRMALQQAHVALGWTGTPLVALLRFRFGRGRSIAHGLRRWYRDRRRARGDTTSAASRAPSSRTGKTPPTAPEHSG